MTEKLRQAFADDVRARGLDWSFCWVSGEKVFTNLVVQLEWQNILREHKPC